MKLNIKLSTINRKIGFLSLTFFLSIIITSLTLGQTKFADQEFIVKFTEEAAKKLSFGFENSIALTGIESIDDLNRRFEVQSIERIFRFAGKYESRHQEFGFTRIYRFIYKSDVDVLAICEEYKPDINLQYVQPNYKNELIDIFPNDPNFSQQWGLHNTGQTGGTPDADIDAPEAWQIEKGNSSVIVGIIDTGRDLDHPDLVANAWINTGEIPDNGIDDDGNGYVDDYYGYDVSDDDSNPDDYHGHGSHCSGIVSMVTDNGEGGAGTSWYCKVMAVKGFPNSYDDVMAECIVYAADNGANVLSNSWGKFGSAPLILDALEYAQDYHNCVTVFAAGNYNTSTPFYPAYYELNIAVAATNHYDKKAGFSDYGDWVDISAPGVNIFSCVIGGYANWDGTSMATPFVAGVAGLVFSQHPDWTNDEVRAQIESTTDNIDHLNPDYEGLLGTGRLNAANAVGASPPEPPDIAVDPTSFTFTVPEGGTASDIMTISNIAPVGSQNLVWHITEQYTELVLENAQTIPVQLKPTNSTNHRISFKHETNAYRREVTERLNNRSHLEKDILNSSTAKLNPTDFPVGREKRNHVEVATGEKAVVSEELDELDDTLLDVAVLGTNSGSLPDVQSKLLTTGLFNSVTTVDIELVIPTLDELLAFDAVLVFYSPQPLDPVELGDNLADYVDAGGGVVVCEFAILDGASFPDWNIQGRFDTDDYWAIEPTDYLTVGPEFLGTVHDPDHPIMEGVTNFNGGSSSYRPSSVSLHPEATMIAEWTDGNPLVVVREINGVQRVDLGFFPPSSDVRSDFWDASTDGAKLMANALVFVAGGITGCPWLSENPTSGTIPASSSQDVDIIVDATGLGVGTYDCNMLINSNDLDEPVVTVPVQLNVEPFIPPDIEVDPLSFDVTLPPGGARTEIMTIGNVGEGVLEFDITDQEIGAGLSVNKRITINPPSDDGPNEKVSVTGPRTVDVKIIPRSFDILTIDLGIPENTGALDLLGFPYTVVSPSEFAAVNLSDYDVLYIGWTIGADPAGMEALYNRKTDIAAFVSAGGGLVALSNRGSSPYEWAWLPMTIDFFIEEGESVVINDPDHPIMNGLTDELLSDWSNSYHTPFNEVPAGLSLLASTGAGYPVTVAGNYGTGRVALTGQDPDWHVYYGDELGAKILLENMLNWVGEAGDAEWLSENPMSGTISASESAPIYVNFDATSLVPADYYAQILINSNDPDEPIVIVDVHLLVESLNPDIEVDPLSFDVSVPQGGTTTEIMTIGNEGEGRLEFNIIEAAANPPLYSAQTSRTGNIESLKSVSQNVMKDTQRKLVAKPRSLQKDNNEGGGPPTKPKKPISELLRLRGTIQILAWIAYTDYDQEYVNTLNAITQFYTDLTITETATTDPAVLQSELMGKNVFLVPEPELADNETLAELGAAFSTILNDFVSNGGTVIVCCEWSSWQGFLLNSGLMAATFQNGYWEGIFDVVDPSHPLSQGLGSTVEAANAVASYSITNPDIQNVIVDGDGYPVLAARDIGLGHVVLNGYDYYAYHDDAARIIANTVQWIGEDIPWLSEDPIAENVPPGGSKTVEVNFDATYLEQGVYYAQMLVNSNDPDEPVVFVQVKMTVGKQTRLWVEDAYGVPGTTDNPMDFSLENEMGVCGVEFVAEFDGELLTATDALTTARSSDMTIAKNIWPDSIKILLYSATGDSIEPGTGPIIQLMFNVDASAPAGDSTLVHLKDAKVADCRGDPVEYSPNVTTEDGWFHFGMKGDVNGDGEVDIFDLVKLINFILDKADPTPYEFWASDINDDGELDIFDVVKMIKIILEGEPIALAKMNASPAHSGELSVPDVALIPNQATEVPIYATFDGTVAGVQLVLHYDPQALKVSAPVLTSRTKQMELASTDKDGKLTILIYSSVGNVIDAGSDPILNLRVETLSGFNGATRLDVENAIAVNGTAEAISVNFSTGNIATAKPQSYSLSQNYPNPFNPATTIKFELPQDVKVTLTVYNLRGEEVRNLIDQNVTAGYHTVTWDGRDNARNNVAAGVYIYRMEAGSFTCFRKMAFLK